MVLQRERNTHESSPPKLPSMRAHNANTVASLIIFGLIYTYFFFARRTTKTAFDVVRGRVMEVATLRGTRVLERA